MLCRCERCFEEYEQGEIYPSKHFDKVLCVPCEKEYERELERFRIDFINMDHDRS